MKMLMMAALAALTSVPALAAADKSVYWASGVCEGVALDLSLGTNDTTSAETRIDTRLDEAARNPTVTGGAVVHDGSLVRDETWAEGTTHLVTSAFYVPEGRTLTIEPGAVVKFCTLTGLVVRDGGVCVANGVTFTHVGDDGVGGETRYNGAVAVAQDGLYVLSGAISTNETTVTKYGPVDSFDKVGATAATAAIDERSESVWIVSNPTNLTYSTRWDGAADVKVTETAPGAATRTLVSKAAVADGDVAWSPENGLGAYAFQHVTAKNTLSATLVVPVPAMVTGDMTLAGGVTHFVPETIVIPVGATLTIQPGAIVKFAPGATISVASNGCLQAVGEVGREIVFTSARDGESGLALPGFGDRPTAYDWPEFVFEAGALGRIDRSVFRYCGSSGGALDLARFGENVALDAVTCAANVTNSGDRVRTITLKADRNGAFLGHLNGNVAVNKTGKGTLAYGDVQGNSGNTTVSEGTLQLAGSQTAVLTPIRLWYKRGGHGTDWKNLPTSEYDGMITTNSLSMFGKGNWRIPQYFQNAQSRVEGWFFIPESDVGRWTVKMNYDDYMAIAFDDQWLIECPTYNTTYTATWTATAGWHRFKIICGDTGGDYGSCVWEYAIHVAINGGKEIDFHEDNIRFADAADEGTVVEVQTAGERTLTLSDGTVVPNDPEQIDALWKSNFLTHRWSFNGTLEDSVGGQTATLNGTTPPTFQESNTVIRLPGGGKGTGWVSLGANVLPSCEPVTVEIWARENAIGYYGRIFDVGVDSSRYAAFAWDADSSESRDCMGCNGDNHYDNFGGFTVGIPYHISVSFRQTADGLTEMTCRKIERSSGELLFASTFMAPGGWTLRNAAQDFFNLGHSFFSEPDVASDYDEVRVWNAALSEEQLRLNALAGPDSVLSLKSIVQAMPSYEIAEGATLDVNGGTLFCNDVTGSGTVQNALLATGGSVDAGLSLQGVSVAGDDSPRVRVTFDLDGRGTRAGGGALVQDIAVGTGASAPTVVGKGGWLFTGWDRTFDQVTQNLTVKAQYMSLRVDLRVTEVDVTNCVLSGSEVATGWTLRNFGNMDWNGKLSEEVRLVNVADTNDVRTVWRGVTECAVPCGETLARSADWTIPLKGWTGNWRVEVETAIGAAYEVADNNVTAAAHTLTVEQRPLPDLSVKSLGLDATAYRPLDTVTVSYVVQNTGAGAAVAPWVETLYAAQGERRVKLGSLAVTDDLAAGATASRTLRAVLPQLFELAGDVSIYVKVDSADALVEQADDESAEESVWLSKPNAHVAQRLYLTATKTSVKENSPDGIRLTARRSGPADEELTAALAVTCPVGEVMAPECVVFAAGARTATFAFAPVDNAAVDGPRDVGVTLSAAGYESVETVLTVTDDEVPSLKLMFDRTDVREGEGVIHATVTRDLVTDGDLVVYLSGASTAQCGYPTSVTIRGGEASATFDVVLVNDDVGEGTASLNLRATADGFVAGNVAFTVADDDVPGVTLALTPTEVSEGAGVNAIYATLTRADSDTVDKAVTVKFDVSEAGRLIVPETVTIPAYTMSVRFAISTVDNDAVDGDAKVTITGRIRLKNGSLADPSNGQSIEQTVLITDDDVPALSLRAEPSTMREGVEHAGDLILSHNSVLDEDLTVTLTVDGEGEIDIPETVTIPKGELSVTIPVTTLSDGVTDGGRLVSVSADDPNDGFKSASTWLQVSDVDLPDFRVEEVAVPVSVFAGKKFETTFAVSNRGFADHAGDIPFAVYLLKGANTQPSEKTKVGEGRIEGGLAAGETTELVWTLSANDATGDYRVAVTVDPAAEIGELDEADNTTYSTVISVGAPYAASAAPAKAVYLPGEDVVIAGRAVQADGVTPAAGKPVDVYVTVGGARRVWSVTTDAQGTFSHVFTPVEGEAGTYGVGAVYSGIAATTAQGTFDILGLRRTLTANVVWDIAIGDEVERTVRLQNLSGVDLTGLAVTVDGVPAECQIAHELGDVLPGNGFADLRFVATALADSPQNDYAKMTAHVTTAEGLSLTFPLYFHSKSLKAQLKATPSSIDAAMTLGAARQFEVTVRNDGRGASGPITVALPEAPYLRLVSPSTIDGLAGGETAVITFEVAPEEAHGLVLNSPLRGGKLAVNCENGAGAAVALAFTPVSESTGALVVDAIDNNTYMLASSPHLEGATVRVSNPYTGAVVASGTTGADGTVRFEGLPQGLYNIRTSAPHHATATDSVTVEPGGAATREMFLAYQLVSATWDVVPVEIEDSYEVNLILDFETTVPAPQVKITMPGEFAEMMPGDTTAFTIHVANTGLVRADEVVLTPPAIPGHSFVFQDNGFALAAGAARDIAVRFMRDVDDPPGPVYMDEGQWAMMMRVAWPCGKERPVYEYPTYFGYGRAVYVDPLEELLRRAQGVRTYSEPDDNGGPTRDFSGDGEELDAGNMDDTDANTFVKTKGQAKVSLKLSQKITMTREAFDGTLTVYNGDAETPIRNLKLALSITDADGNACNGDNYFLKLDQGASGGISGGFVLDGGAEIAPNDSGTARIRFIPTRQTAESEPTVYRIGGTLTYIDPTRGEPATLELVPVTITVHPSPYLKLDYFVQRDVFGDDPLTEDVVEASQPAEIAVLVRNTGAGDAKGVTIASAQPEVFRNESGLDIAFELRDYDLEAMAVDGKAAQAGLRNVTLGTIPAGESKVAQWWLLSTLSGHFLGMSGTVTPLNSWNTPDTALVDPEVGVHKLIRSFESNGRTCFLTSEADDDLYGRPDTVYTPDGEAEPAHLDEGATVTGSLLGAETAVTISSADVVPGWNVVSPVVEGAFRYEVVSVTRSDGTELPARNCWVTDRTFVDGDEPLMEERLNLVDSLASGAAVSWTVVLRAKPTAAVEVVSFDVVDETVENTVRDVVVVEFSATIDPASFTAEDLVLKHQGVRVVDLQPLVLTRLTDTRYRIGGLAALASGYGRNELTVQCAGIADLSGRCGETGRAVAWLYSSAEAPYVIDVTGAPVTRVSSFDALTTVMSVPIDERSFAGAYVTLNGRDVSDLVSFTAADAVGTRWTISGLEALQTADGDYTLALDCSSLRSSGGEGGSLTYRQSWVRDTMAPAPVSFARTSGLGGGSCVVTMSEPVAAGCISLSNFSLTHDGRSVALPATARVGRIGETGYSLTGFESACGADGDYRLTFSAVGVTDEAGNAASGSQSVSWVVNRTPPAPATDIVVSSPYGSVDSRVLTASRLMTVSATVPEDGLSVAVVARSPSGVETVLARPEVGGDRRFETEIELPGEGNFTVLIRLSDADGNVSDAEFRAYVDGIDLEAELTGAPEVGHAAGDVELTFSEAVEESDVRQATISLALDGAPLAVEGVTVERISDSAYVIRGLDELTADYGEYVLSVDVNGVRKASTGKLCGRTASLSWTNELVDEVAPFVVDVRLDGEAPTDEYVRMFSTVSVTFSEPVNMAQLIRKDMAGQALYVELLDDEGKTWKTVPARDVRWNEETAAVSWTVAHDDIPCGLARIVVSSALVKDMAGNALTPVDAYETIRSAKTYAPSILMDRAAAAYAAPALHDWNNDGLLDLIVGELTPDGKGKVRLYLNRGSLTRPSFEDFSYLDYRDSELELSGGDDLGVHVSFASAHTRRMTLVAGDGRIYDWNYGFVNRKTLERADLRVREQTVADLPDYAVVSADVNGDLVVDRVAGDAVGNVVAFLGLGGGLFADEPLTLYANEGRAGVARIAVGDLDGDGLEDIVVGRPDGSVVFLKAEALQSQAVTFARVREVPIDEALGMDVYWEIGGRWSCEQVGTDAKAVCRIEDGGSDCVTARFEGPGTVTFTWGCDGANVASVCTCSEGQTQILSRTGPFALERGSLELVGEGAHFVTWRLAGSNKAVLRDVAFASVDEHSQRVESTGVLYADIRRLARNVWKRMAGDYQKTVDEIAANGRPVWENCIAGLDCDDPEARFVASVEFDADGRPVVTWSPALNDTEDVRGVREGVRTYCVFGKKSLDDPKEGWREVSKESESECNFFKVTVAMPQGTGQ